MIDKSTDGGEHFGALQGGFDHVIHASASGIMGYPVLATSRSDLSIVYAVWEENWDVWFARSDDGGNTWAVAFPLNDQGTLGTTSKQFKPWMDVDATNGNINVVWYDNRNDPANGDQIVDVYFDSSSDGGDTFSADRRITTVSSSKTPRSMKSATASERSSEPEQ
jgi:hypothetical protein